MGASPTAWIMAACDDRSVSCGADVFHCGDCSCTRRELCRAQHERALVFSCTRRRCGRARTFMVRAHTHDWAHARGSAERACECCRGVQRGGEGADALYAAL